MTPLDRAAQAMQDAPEDEALRRAWFANLAAAELFLLLDGEPVGDRLKPRVFDLDDGPVALAFDTEERLAGFAGESHYAALSGRSLAAMLAEAGLSLGLNFSAGMSETLLPPDALSWLTGHAVLPVAAPETPTALLPPPEMQAEMLRAIDTRLSAAAGLARRAVLAGARDSDAGIRPVLVIIDPEPGAEDALARTIGEAVAIAGQDPGQLDITFVSRDSAAAAMALEVGLAIDLPLPPQAQAPAAPGLDPDRPPKLR